MRTSRLLFMIILFSALIPVAGCLEKPKPPQELIPEEVYTDLLAETIMMGYYIQMMDMENRRDSLFTVLFHEFGVTQAEFDSSHVWYHREEEAQSRRIEAVRRQLDEELRRLEDATRPQEP